MDLETENRIASILLKEASELRRKAQQEGALAYLRQPTVRGRPNSRFLTATVRGIQQANRAVEMNEMWRVREKELELDERCQSGSIHTKRRTNRNEEGEYSESGNKRRDLHGCSDASCSSTKQFYQDRHSKDDEGLRDEELELFLNSRAKRGRGSVGSRMDEAGPYLSASNHFEDDERYHRARSILGPQKPSSWKPSESSSSDESSDEDKCKRLKVSSEGLKKKKKHSKKHSSKEKSRDKKKKRREKRRKH